ncbi:MAG TPA: LysM peptidoglycan-binding domain-containing protein [Dehalococcoidia bacterium]|nr:LysM peptidoglycan-binding domain-containing protein [Dehalococcoidia bacterium]
MVRLPRPSRGGVLAALLVALLPSLLACTGLGPPLALRTPTPAPGVPADQAAGAQVETQPHTAPIEGIEHTVAEGETLWSIAEQYGVTLDELIAANTQLSDPDALQVGDVVIVPVAPEPTAEPEPAEGPAPGEGSGGLPDLVVTIPPVVVDGRLALNVKNQGGAPLGKTVIRVAVRDGDRTLATTSVTVDELRPGASVDVPTNLAVAGYDRLTAVVDPDALIEESVEDNNAVLLEFGRG